MLRLIKYLFITALALIVLTVGAGFFAITYFEQDIKQWLINSIETKSDAKITLDDLGIRPFKFFPGIAMSVSNVTVQSAFIEDTLPLLKSDELYIIINPFQLLSAKTMVSKFAVSNGQLFLHRRLDGSANYNIITSDNPKNPRNKSKDEIEIGLEQVILDNVHFIYKDEKSNLTIDLKAHEANIDGNFASGNLSLYCKGKLTSNAILIGDIDYAHSKDIVLEGTVLVGNDKTYGFNTNYLKIEDNTFIASGKIEDNTSYTGLDIKVKGDELNINKLLELLPARFSNRLTEYDFDGDLEFDVAILGKLSKTEYPKIDINYEIFNTTLIHSSLVYPVKKLSFKGSFSNGWAKKLASSKIKFDAINATINGDLLQGTVHVFNLVNPKLDIEANGFIELGLINSFLSDSAAVKNIEGGVTFNKVVYKGDALAFNKIETKPLGISGNFLFSNVGFSLNNHPIKINTLNFSPNGYTINIKELIAEGLNSTINISGSTTYLREFALKAANPWMQWNKPLELNLSAKLPEIGIDSILSLFITGNDSTSNEGIQQTITGLINLDIGILTYEKFTARNLVTEISFKPGEVHVAEVDFNAMSGAINAEANYVYGKNKSQLYISGTLSNLSIEQLFYQFNNFGQEELTSKHLKGIANCSIKGNIPFVNDTVDFKNIHLLTSIKIKKGELINFAPLQELSDFIDIEELKHIRFNQLENDIEIKDGIINIPDMEIQTSALGLALKGTHSFTNYIDYDIKLNVMPVLAGKIRKRKKKLEFQTVDEDEYNGFVTMKGPLDDPVIDFKLGRFAQQKEELKDAFKGKMKDYNAKKEMQDWQVDEELEFLD